MISFRVDHSSRFGIDSYLATRGAAIAGHFLVQPYEDLGTAVPVNAGAQIFTALDQLGPAGLAMVTELCDRIGEAAPAWLRLNDPRRVLLRPSLLDTLATAGLNGFRAWPATGPLGGVRFPVFVRMANRHTGNLTGLLDSPAALRRALRALRFRGARLGELLVVEYLHTADDQGRFRKYSAYRVGSALVRTHLFIGHEWSLKSAGDEADVAAAREMHAYITGDEHEDWLWQVFELAGIDFGRADYGVADGRPQLWEINLTPTMCRRPGQPPKPAPPDVRAIRDAAREVAHAGLRAAFLALDGSGSEDQVTVRLPRLLIEEARAERLSEERRRTALAALTRMLAYRALGRPVQAIYGRLLPRG